MRLLQLVTGPGELVDLHPHVTVVAGLDPAGRALLADAVTGLAAGRASAQRGLLEAHGVLFDLAPEALALLDIASDGVHPVVTADDLPSLRPAPPVVEPAPDDPARAELDARWAAAKEADVNAQSAVAAAVAAVAEAAAAPPDRGGDPGLTDDLTAARDDAAAERARLADEQPRLLAAATASAAARAELEASTAAVRGRLDSAIAATAAAADRLEAARGATDLGTAPALEEAVAALATAKGEIDEARDLPPVEPAAHQAPPAERREALERRIQAIETQLAAFAPTDAEEVARRLTAIGSAEGGVLAPLPEAVALADELAALDAELVATDAPGGMPGAGLAEGRARLEDARQGLLEAEHALRRPELDRDLVDRLEQVHADLLDAIEKADGRVFGARAQRRVDALRAEENAVLADLDLPSYSDFMMGTSLLHVDPAKEAALDDARVELSAAEDAWKVLSAETETELARAEQMERRRGLIDEARQLLGRSVPSGAVVEELRRMRVEVEPSAALLDDLRRALDGAGVALEDGELDREELALVAESWLAEAEAATEREGELRRELERLRDERRRLSAAADEPSLGDPVSSERTSGGDAEGRLATARTAVASAQERHHAHEAAQAEVAILAEALAADHALEGAARDAARDADAAMAAALEAETAAGTARDQGATALAEAEEVERRADDALRRAGEHRSVGDGPSPALVATEAVHAAALARAAETAARLADIEAQRAAAEAARAPDVPAGLEEAEDATAPPVSEALEWYLLARLAAQRSVSLAGSVPLLLDDAPEGLPPADVEHVLGRLERMAAAVQVIVVTDDPTAASWALLAGADRAAVVAPEPSSTR